MEALRLEILEELNKETFFPESVLSSKSKDGSLVVESPWGFIIQRTLFIHGELIVIAAALKQMDAFIARLAGDRKPTAEQEAEKKKCTLLSH